MISKGNAPARYSLQTAKGDNYLEKLQNARLVEFVRDAKGASVMQINQDGSLSSNVKHVKREGLVSSTPDLIPDLMIREASWDELENMVDGKSLFEINLFVVSWRESGLDTSCYPTKPVPLNYQGSFTSFDPPSKQTIHLAGLGGLDRESRTFSIFNSLNNLGPGNSGALVVGSIEGNLYLLGEVSGLVNGKKERIDLLRCVRSDSIETPIMQDDIPCFNYRQLDSDRVQEIKSRIPSGQDIEIPKGKLGLHWEIVHGHNFDLRGTRLLLHDQLAFAGHLAFSKFYELAPKQVHEKLPLNIAMMEPVIQKKNNLCKTATVDAQMIIIEKNELKVGVEINVDKPFKDPVKGWPKGPRDPHVGFHIWVKKEGKTMLNITGHVLLEEGREEIDAYRDQR